MAIVYLCDGCCEISDKEELEPRGIMERLYCEACTPVIDEYLTERDDLHDKVQLQWNGGIDKIQKKYHKDFKGRLPDEFKS